MTETCHPTRCPEFFVGIETGDRIRKEAATLLLIAVAVIAAAGARSAFADAAATSRDREVLVVHFDDKTVNPITARFVDRAIREAEKSNASCLVLVLDTPGGLVHSTREIVRRMLASEVPIVV